MTEHDNFLNPLCSSLTLDIYLPRRSVLTALTEQLNKFHGTLLDIGCGRMPYKSILLAPPSRVQKYIGLDLGRSAYGEPDLRWDGWTIPLEPESIDCVLATEVFEHCPDPERVMREASRVLKPSGVLFFTVPFLWPLHDAPHDEYRFTPFSLERHLCSAGFSQIQMKALGGWDASLAQMIGLWVRRRQMPRKLRQILSILALPLVRFLIKRDRALPVFTDQIMITGIAGIAIKPRS